MRIEDFMAKKTAGDKSVLSGYQMGKLIELAHRAALQAHNEGDMEYADMYRLIQEQLTAATGRARHNATFEIITHNPQER
jgi:hypothetical protein